MNISVSPNAAEQLPEGVIDFRGRVAKL